MAGVILCKDSRFRFVYHYRIIGLVYMKDKFFLMHMMPIVRAHIAIFDENGNVKEQLSESREEDLKLYSEIIKKSRKDFPYIILIDKSFVKKKRRKSLGNFTVNLKIATMIYLNVPRTHIHLR